VAGAIRAIPLDQPERSGKEAVPRIRVGRELSATALRWSALCLALLLGASAATYVASSTVAPTAASAADRDCDDFPTQRKAQRFFKRNNPSADPHYLDSDNDRIACEDNRCPCSRKWHRQHGKMALSRRV
jgi:hypothetical protein